MIISHFTLNTHNTQFLMQSVTDYYNKFSLFTKAAITERAVRQVVVNI